MTSEVFPLSAEYLHREDSEIAGERYIEVRVIDNGSMDEILARHDDWHRRITALPANVRRFFRLFVDAQSE